jgi:hypothetical protein
MRAICGNPVRVRHTVECVGKPTVRKAQLLGGNRMPKKRMPVAERQQETGDMCGRYLQAAVPG